MNFYKIIETEMYPCRYKIVAFVNGHLQDNDNSTHLYSSTVEESKEKIAKMGGTFLA